MIKSPPQKYNPKQFEEKILKFWTENHIFKKSIDNKIKCKPYIFLEGPPTANGLPHPGHVLTRVMKDLFLRYQTMNGHYILRKAGWDTHGLPVELEIEKELGLNTKKDILDSFALCGVKITEYSVTDETYEILGDAGIITGRGTIVGSLGEYTFNHDVLFTDIFVFENEQWFYYKSQVTEISREG